MFLFHFCLYLILGELLVILETCPWSVEFSENKYVLLKIKIQSIDAEREDLLKKHGLQKEKIETKNNGPEQFQFRVYPEDAADADKLASCFGEKVKF